MTEILIDQGVKVCRELPELPEERALAKLMQKELKVKSEKLKAGAVD